MSIAYRMLAIAISISLVACSGSTSTSLATDNNSAAAENNVVASDAENTDTSPSSLPEPIGLKGVVYTDTEIELFWDSAEDPNIVQYRILRDGIVLDMLDARSYYDNTVVAGTTYEYSVSSVDANGAFSRPANLFLTTPELSPTINLANAQSILGQVIAASNGALFNKTLMQVYSISRSSGEVEAVNNGFTKRSSESIDMGLTYSTVYDCDVSGQYTVRATTNALPSYFGDLTDCVTNLFPGQTLNGGVSTDRFLSKYVYNTGIGHTLNIDAFSSTNAANETQLLDGEFYYFDSDLDSWSFSQRSRLLPNESGEITAESARSTEPFTFYSPAFEGSTQLSITSINRSKGIVRTADSSEFKHSLTAQFSIQSPTTGNKRITVATPVEFYTDQSDGCFATGQLKLTAEDGSELVLNADNGSVNSALMTVTSDGGSTEQTVLWSGPLAALHATPFDVITGTPAACD